MTKHDHRKQALQQTRPHGLVCGCLRTLGKVLFGLVILVVIFIGLYINSTRDIPEVDMTSTAFTRSSIEANTNAQVHFVDPSDGAVQILCLGSNGQCSTNPLAPAEFDGSGLRIEPGQSITVIFSWAGAYPITSTTTSGMNITIYVHAKQ